MDIWLLCVRVCVFVRLWITPARIKLAASNFARWFRGVLGRESPIFRELCSPRSPISDESARRAAASIADRRQSPALTARLPSVEATGVYRQYLPSACVDIQPSPKTDVLVIHNADRQDVDISCTVFLYVFVFVCTVSDFSGDDKASGVK